MPRPRGEFRIERGGELLDYTCENSKFRTNIQVGETHAPHSQTRGSVFREAVVDHVRVDGYSLWFEHVVEPKSGVEGYWLIWYLNGRPKNAASAFIDKRDLRRFKDLLSRLET